MGARLEQYQSRRGALAILLYVTFRTRTFDVLIGANEPIEMYALTGQCCAKA